MSEIEDIKRQAQQLVAVGILRGWITPPIPTHRTDAVGKDGRLIPIKKCQRRETVCRQCGELFTYESNITRRKCPECKEDNRKNLRTNR